MGVSTLGYWGEKELVEAQLLLGRMTPNCIFNRLLAFELERVKKDEDVPYHSTEPILFLDSYSPE